MSELKALIFDCDGVIAETERDGHREAFNIAFMEKGIAANWSVEEYGRLLKISGGKERIKAYFSENSHHFPLELLQEEPIKELHKRKTEIFMEMSATGRLPSRLGVKRLVKEAHDNKIFLFICSTSHKNSVTSLVKANLGEEYLSWFSELFCGDIVENKKPSPDIYNLVKVSYGLKGSDCFVVEDTENGLLAAKAAGMNCIITPSFYSMDEDFTTADLVVSSIGEPHTPNIQVFKSNPKLKHDIAYVSIQDLKLCALEI